MVPSRSIVSLAYCFTTTAALYSAEGGVCRAQDGVKDGAKAAAHACLSNTESFDRVVCKYKVTKARAATPEDALAGRYTREGLVGRFTLAIDGDRLSKRVVDGEKATRARTEAKKTPMPGNPNVLIGPVREFTGSSVANAPTPTGVA